MAIKDVLAKLPPTEDSTKVPAAVEERMKRGRARMKDGAPKRTECLNFWENKQYTYVSDDKVRYEPTVTTADGRGKPRWVARTQRNLLVDVVAQEVSASTSRVPSYEVNPSTADQPDISAASLAGKVARYGYDKWNVRSVTAQVVTYAVVADEGFAWPFWDSSVGPYMQDADGNVVGQGEIGIRVFGPNETFWEPGLKFDESRWHAIEQARTAISIMQMDGYIGPQKLDNDATDKDGHGKLVMVTEYLERPSKIHPNGRWLTIANGKQVLPERPFPCVDEQGRTVDEPVLHHLCYFTNPDSDRDMGLVRHLIDAQRTINECVNQQILWQRLALNPQVIIQNGEFKQRITNEPGAVYNAVGTGQILWRPVPDIPGELGELKDEARSDIAQIAAQNQIPAQISSAQAVQALLAKDQNRRGDLFSNVAEFHSRLMRHCLYLVQKHYTEPRLLKVRGEDGTEVIQDFLGADLRGQADVTVDPGTIEPRSREQIEQRVMTFAQLGWISPEDAMYAINAGTADGLVKTYERDQARAYRIIQKLREGPDVLFAVPPRRPFPDEDPGFQVDPNGQPLLDQMGQPIPNETVPGWMPRPFDNIRVQKTVLEDFMKTDEYEQMDPATQEAANLYYAELLNIEAQKAAREAAMQTQMAQDLGMANAAQPQTGKPMPSQPALAGSGNGNGNPTNP